MSLSSLAMAVLAAGLTVQPGETWLFRLAKGEPVAAQRVAASALPAPGQIKLTAKRMLGTMITLQNNSPTGYIFRATLVAADGKPIAARTCVLPGGNRLVMESWPQAAVAVRIADFKPSTATHCR